MQKGVMGSTNVCGFLQGTKRASSSLLSLRFDFYLECSLFFLPIRTALFIKRLVSRDDDAPVVPSLSTG
ncbi:Uncharacterized protein HZ326_16370 [Fusarium oxysporum f. sp. albedinis]|nr:Uncharacterized protein HZ326_16370 [Fusarium oxysporum f. sp. albedinis]